jgi:hypothetical protein
VAAGIAVIAIAEFAVGIDTVVRFLVLASGLAVALLPTLVLCLITCLRTLVLILIEASITDSVVRLITPVFALIEARLRVSSRHSAVDAELVGNRLIVLRPRGMPVSLSAAVAACGRLLRGALSSVTRAGGDCRGYWRRGC